MKGEIGHYRELVDYFLDSCSFRKKLKIGAEFENLAVFAHSGKAIPYRNERGVTAILSGLSQKFGWEPLKENGELIALSREGDRPVLPIDIREAQVHYLRGP